MITTQLGMQTFMDQLLAALNDGPATSEECAARVGTVICHCTSCAGRQRRANPTETEWFLKNLVAAGEVAGHLTRLAGVPCPDCGNHDAMVIRYERTRSVDQLDE